MRELVIVFGCALAIGCAGTSIVDVPQKRAVPAAVVQAGMAGDYTAIDLGFLPGGLTGTASAINDSGWIAGVSSSLSGDRVFLYKNGVMLDHGGQDPSPSRT